MLKYLLFNLMLAGVAYGGESILASTKVPNRIIPQGEVRLVERGPEIVVQSAIKTRFPGKVFNKISKNEEKNWAGNAEMEVYITALEAAFAEYETRDKGTVLLIDFVAGANGTRVDLHFPPNPIWRTLPLSASYVQKNQEYILAEAFGKKSGAIIQTLRNLNPLDESHE